jgi:GNAT superfamily N-acetyltransferase
MKSYHVRKAIGHDGEGILRCLAVAFEPYRHQYTSAAYSDTVLDSDLVQRRFRQMCVFVAVSEGLIVGTLACKENGEEGHLRGMAVLPEWQGTHVAVALLQAAENELRQNHCMWVTLDTTAPLQRATRFYEKHGFAASGRISDFFGMPLIEYVKSLAPVETDAP